VESHLNNTIQNNTIQIEGYSIQRKDRINKKGGGLLTYTNNRLLCNRRTDLENANLEIMWLEIKTCQQSPTILLGQVYRPPSTDANTDDLLLENINCAASEDKPTWIMGDINIDLSNKQNLKHKFYKHLTTFGFKQLISTATRIPSNTCIDHIYTNEPSNVLTTLVEDIGLSDHRPICAVRKLKGSIPRPPGHKHIEYRCFKNFNGEKFKEDLASVPWNSMSLFEDPNDKCETFYDLFMEVINNHAPLKKKRVKTNQQAKWFTNDLNILMKHRDYLLKKARHKPKDSVEWQDFRERNAKRKFFHDALNNNRANSKDLWKHLKLLRNTQPSNVGPTKQDHLSCDKDIADFFNAHFTTPKATIASQSQPNYNVIVEFTKKNKHENTLFEFTSIDSDFVTKQIKKMSDSKGSGIDEICVKLLKAALPYIADPLVDIINSAIKTGVYPKLFKHAKICPVYKKGDINDPSNYRPIAVLPIVSKIMERHLHNQLSSYLDEYNLLLDNQSGFRSRHSCETLLLKLTDSFLENMDKGNINTAILIDLSKAFDNIDHQILIRKLEHYDIAERPIQLMRSFLDNRSQTVIFRGTRSKESASPAIGIPQGSIISPLLFNIYLNDLTFYINSNVDMYADDITVYTAHKEPNVIEKSLNNDMTSISTWFEQNGLSISKEKTEKLSISTRHKSKESREVSINIGSSRINDTECHKLLGLQIDKNLDWKEHVNYVIKKVNSRLSLLRRIKCFLPQFARMLFYNSMIQPILDYGLTIYCTCSKEDLKRVHKLQKRAGRTILDIRKTRDISTIDLFKKLEWIPINERAKLLTATMMFKCQHNMAPKYLSCKFNNHNSRKTRLSSKGQLTIPLYKTNNGQRTFKFRATKIWNELPIETKSSKTIELFKKHFINFYYGDIYDQSFYLDT